MGLKERAAMTETNNFLLKPWTREKAVLLSLVCLMAGIIGGWAIRASLSQSAAATAQAPASSLPAGPSVAPAPQMPDAARLKQMADAQAGPQLDKLKADPNNPDLLTSIGNLYYDAQQYPVAVDYYQRALKVRPADAAVRTDMATAYWYLGNADSAIAEFNKALTYAPTNPNTLFNLGLVKWKGKMDAAGALADWQKLLATNPSYPEKDKVEQMMDEVKKHTEGKQ
jgi:tetratricopeptide (TPR) repeat protein